MEAQTNKKVVDKDVSLWLAMKKVSCGLVADLSLSTLWLMILQASLDWVGTNWSREVVLQQPIRCKLTEAD